MAKEVAGLIKLQIKGGAANPSPPVGPALGSKGINIMEFCKQFNARTQDKAGKILPVIITYYADKSFDFVIKTPPVAIQLLEVTKQKSGSAEPNRKKVAELTWDQIRAIDGSLKHKHTINSEICIKCGACFENCKFNAVEKL